LKTLAVSSRVQLAGGALENAKPGREGITTSKATTELWFFLPDVLHVFVVRESMIGMNSAKDPGHPWTRSKGIAFGALDFWWR